MNREITGPAAVFLDQDKYSQPQRELAYKLFLQIITKLDQQPFTMGLVRVRFTGGADVAEEFHTFRKGVNLHDDLRKASHWLEDTLKESRLVEGSYGGDLPLGVESAFWFKEDSETIARSWELLAAFATAADEQENQIAEYLTIADFTRKGRAGLPFS